MEVNLALFDVMNMSWAEKSPARDDARGGMGVLSCS